MLAMMTAKQAAIMDAVFKGNDEGDFLDIEELRGRLSHKPCLQAIQCSIRILEKHGLIERTYEHRRGYQRMVIKPTMLAYRTLRPGGSVGM